MGGPCQHLSFNKLSIKIYFDIIGWIFTRTLLGIVKEPLLIWWSVKWHFGYALKDSYLFIAYTDIFMGKMQWYLRFVFPYCNNNTNKSGRGEIRVKQDYLNGAHSSSLMWNVDIHCTVLSCLCFTISTEKFRLSFCVCNIYSQGIILKKKSNYLLYLCFITLYLSFNRFWKWEFCFQIILFVRGVN